MENIFYSAVKEEIPLTLRIPMIILIVFLIIYLLYIYQREREKYINEMFFDLLHKSIFQGTFDEETLFRIYKNRNEKLISRIFNYDTSYDRFINSFLVYTIDKKPDFSSDDSYRRKAKDVIDKISDRPYSNVNERERRILLSIDDIMKNSVNLADSEKSSIKHNLDDLAIALEENMGALKKSQKSNRLTWLGILITVIFGIISIILSL